MNIYKRFYLSLLFIFLGSSTFLIMPLSSSFANKTNRISLFIVGLLFWGFFIAGYSFLFYVNKNLKTEKTKIKNTRPGIITVCSNKLATVSDLFMVLLFIVFVITQFIGLSDYYIYVILFLLVFSINMHCILNGGIYKSIRSRSKKKGELFK